MTIVRLLLFSTWRLALLRAAGRPAATTCSRRSRPRASRRSTYHRDYAGRWFLTLAQGTDESRRRLRGRARRWSGRCTTSCSRATRSSEPSPRSGVGVDPATVADEVAVLLEQVFSVSGVERPDVPQVGPVDRRHGPRRPAHRGAGTLLAEMQVGRPGAPEGAVVSMPTAASTACARRRGLA